MIAWFLRPAWSSASSLSKPFICFCIIKISESLPFILLAPIHTCAHTHCRCFPSVLCSMACELICWSGTMSPQAGLFNDKLCCCCCPAHCDICWKHKGTAAEIGFVSISSILTSFAVPLQGLCGAELETEWNSEIGRWPWPCLMYSCTMCVFVCTHSA